MNYIHSDNDFAVEPARGLPALLPRGEFIVWQGAPNWQVFARQVFRTRLIGTLVCLAALTRLAMSLSAGSALGVAAGEAAVILTFGCIGIAILWLMAWLVQKTTVYTITNKRILMRIGVALQKTFNIPFAVIDEAHVKKHGQSAGKNNGTISVSFKPGTSLAYLILWPHARPWKMGHTQPSLRGIAKVDDVARLLTDSFTSHAKAEEALKVAAANIPSVENNTPAARIAKPKDHHAVGKIPLAIAASIVVLTVIGVGLNQWTSLGQNSAITQGDVAPAFEMSILFQDIEGNEILVSNEANGETIAIVQAGSDGLLRGALRGLGRSRVVSDVDLSAPYQLQRLEGDGVYIADALTGRSIRLDSFGPIVTGAVGVLMQTAQGSSTSAAVE